MNLSEQILVDGMDDNEMNHIDNGEIRTELAIVRTLMAEKRTHFAELRTGIGVLTIPMSLLTILVATSNYYSISEVFFLVATLVFGIVCLSVFGMYLVVSALKKLRENDKVRRRLSPNMEALLEKNGWRGHS